MKEFEIKDAPLEIERKFLIRYPDMDLLKQQKGYHCIHIEQTYLRSGDGIKGGRIRKLKQGDRIWYMYTYKEKISDITRHEYERELERSEYEELLCYQKEGSVTIIKDRHVFAYQGLVYELDIYDFWTEQATLESEVDSEDTPIPIPPFLTLIKEVTCDPRYNNSRLAFNRGVIEP